MAKEEIQSIFMKTSSTMKPSLHKSLNLITSKPDTVLIGGLEDVKNQIKDLLSLISNQKLYRKIKVGFPKGR